MAERNTQSAARLSEDIGDVLTAIRRLIAEDEALSAARDRVMDDRSGNPGIIDEDSAEFLARRHGGNAAMARKLARRRFGVAEPAGNDDAWPLGRLRTGPTLPARVRSCPKRRPPIRRRPTKKLSSATPMPLRRALPCAMIWHGPCHRLSLSLETTIRPKRMERVTRLFLLRSHLSQRPRPRCG